MRYTGSLAATLVALSSVAVGGVLSTGPLGGASNSANGDISVEVGGYLNGANGFASVTVGGAYNFNNATFGVIGGGYNNDAVGTLSTIAGGGQNAAGDYGSVAGGYGNLAGGAGSVGGGFFNSAGGSGAVVSGGLNNNASGNLSFIGGGRDNIASGAGSAVIAGTSSTATGILSLAFGSQANASGKGSIVFKDSLSGTFTSTGDDTFNVKADGGIFLSSTKVTVDATLSPANVPTIALETTGTGLVTIPKGNVFVLAPSDPQTTTPLLGINPVAPAGTVIYVLNSTAGSVIEIGDEETSGTNLDLPTTETLFGDTGVLQLISTGTKWAQVSLSNN
jgi:hypothetical protein